MFRKSFSSALLLSASLTAFLAGAPAAHAESRVALVIGESAYRAVPSLPNPVNDAKVIGKLLTDSGFEVTTASDLSQKEFDQKVGDFTAEIAARGPDTVALVFYAGHGLQVDGENYLVPVDVDPKREADIPLQAVRLNDVLNTLNSVPTRMRILLLDACRNNPFPALNQSVGHGLAMVDTKTGAPGTFLSYSTSPGAEAEDGAGADSPYTTALLTAARTPGLPIEQAFKQVRVAVNKATDGRQTPWESSSLTEDFRFVAATEVRDANAAIPPASNAGKRTVDQWKRDLAGKQPEAAHEMIVADGTLEAYQAYDALFAQSRFAPEVREWIVRDRKMVAWNEAVTINTAASYRSFLAEYPDTDLSITARTLIGRLRYRPSPLPQVAALCTPPLAPNAPSSPSILKKVDVVPARGGEPHVTIKKVEVTPRREPDPPAPALPPHRTIVVEGPVYGGPYGGPPMMRPGGFGGGFHGSGMMGRPIGFGRRF
ncbi:MAG: caspase family protein [Bradyrhizobium sp.]|nr:caspase family protein [Bradyrhizobium sp.]